MKQPTSQPTSALQRFPPELRRRVAELADDQDVHQLAVVSSAWREPAESVLWRILCINTPDHLDDALIHGSGHPVGLQQVYAHTAFALRSHTPRASYVRTLFLEAGPQTGSHAAEIFRACSGAVRAVFILGGDGWRTRQDWAEQSGTWYETLITGGPGSLPLSLVALKKLCLQLGPTWATSLRAVLEHATNVEELSVSLSEPLVQQPEITWPTLPRLRKLASPMIGKDVISFAVRCVQDLAPRIEHFEIVIPHALDGEADSVAKICQRPGLKTLSFAAQLQLGTLQRLLDHTTGVSTLEELNVQPATWPNLFVALPAFPHLARITAETPHMLISTIMEDLRNANDVGIIPPELPSLETNAHLAHFRLQPQVLLCMRGVIRFSDCCLDVFTFTNGIRKIHHLALRVTRAMLRYNEDFKAPASTSGDNVILEPAMRAAVLLVGDFSAYRWSAQRGVWLDDPELTTIEIAATNDRVLPERIWREMYRLSRVEEHLQGHGRRDMELSPEAWTLFAEWETREKALGVS